MDQHLVTIAITTYNSNINFLSEALDSAINQTYKNIEIIVADDCSNNISQIEDLIHKKKDKRIFLLKSFENLGVSHSLNKIVAVSKGAYFNWCPDDDYLDPLKVEIQIKSLEKKPEAISVSDHFQFIDYYKFKRKISHKIYLKFFNIFEYIICLDRINGGSLLIPTLYLKTIQFNKNLKYVQDYDMWLSLFKKKEYVYVNRALFFSRKHKNQLSETSIIKSTNEISQYYLNFIKSNIFDLIYYNGKKIYLFIILFYQYRNINSVVYYCKKEYDNVKLIYNSSKLFYCLIYLSKTLGFLLLFLHKIKNFFFYSFFLRLWK
jgi:glycosyltransferase involved in cell wall biosynthesis